MKDLEINPLVSVAPPASIDVPNILKITKNGEITYDRETQEYTVWEETYCDIVCVTPYEKVARAALEIYCSQYKELLF